MIRSIYLVDLTTPHQQGYLDLPIENIRNERKTPPEVLEQLLECDLLQDGRDEELRFFGMCCLFTLGRLGL